jgi:hypothetical protein
VKTIAQYGTALVFAHFVISLFHGRAHADLHVGLSPVQTLFVLLVITLCPLVGAALLWTRLRRAGTVLLATSMFGSLVFGAWNHFVASGSDHVAHVPAGAAGRMFQITAVLLAVTEAAGTWLGILWLRGETGKRSAGLR